MRKQAKKKIVKELNEAPFTKGTMLGAGVFLISIGANTLNNGRLWEGIVVIGIGAALILAREILKKYEDRVFSARDDKETPPTMHA